jgi:hypothetical protein
MSYVYIRSEPGCYTVGFYAPDGGWNPESDCASKEEAAVRVNYLNGGAWLDTIERLLETIAERLRP